MTHRKITGSIKTIYEVAFNRMTLGRMTFSYTEQNYKQIDGVLQNAIFNQKKFSRMTISVR